MLRIYLPPPFGGQKLLISDFKIDMTMVGAFLTLLGYSINDTIIIYDRIRENRRKGILTRTAYQRQYQCHSFQDNPDQHNRVFSGLCYVCLWRQRAAGLQLRYALRRHRRNIFINCDICADITNKGTTKGGQ